MSTSPATTDAVAGSADTAAPAVVIPQLRPRGVAAVWAAAAVPMATLAWLVAPAVAGHLSGTGRVPMVKALITCLTIGLIWQFVLVAILVGREQGTLRWAVVRDALWLHSPRSPRSGRVGGRVWLILIPLIALFGCEQFSPSLPTPANRDLGMFLGSDAGHAFMHGAWGWYGVLLTCWVFNTVLGEELLFRGYLLPRMNGACGRWDWLVNGVIFACYHLHEPWIIPSALMDTFVVAYPTKRYRSAWIGIAVHSSQSVFFAIIALTLVR